MGKDYFVGTIKLKRFWGKQCLQLFIVPNQSQLKMLKNVFTSEAQIMITRQKADVISRTQKRITNYAFVVKACLFNNSVLMF